MFMLKSELVVSHYNEDLSWLNGISSKFDKITIYHKGNNGEFANVLPNIGREAHTYLWHIVNVKEPAINTVFTQGNPLDHINDVNSLHTFTESPFEWIGDYCYMSNKFGEPWCNKWKFPCEEVATVANIQLPTWWSFCPYANFKLTNKCLIRFKPLANTLLKNLVWPTTTGHLETEYEYRTPWALERLWEFLCLQNYKCEY